MRNSILPDKFFSVFCIKLLKKKSIVIIDLITWLAQNSPAIDSLMTITSSMPEITEQLIYHTTISSLSPSWINLRFTTSLQDSVKFYVSTNICFGFLPRDIFKAARETMPVIIQRHHGSCAPHVTFFGHF